MLETIIIVVSVIFVVGGVTLSWWSEYGSDRKDKSKRESEER